MSNLIKKPWTDSNLHHYTKHVCTTKYFTGQLTWHFDLPTLLLAWPNYGLIQHVGQVSRVKSFVVGIEKWAKTKGERTEMSKVSANSDLCNKRADPNKRVRRDFFSISYMRIANTVENFLICYMKN